MNLSSFSSFFISLGGNLKMNFSSFECENPFLIIVRTILDGFKFPLTMTIFFLNFSEILRIALGAAQVLHFPSCPFFISQFLHQKLSVA